MRPSFPRLTPHFALSKSWPSHEGRPLQGSAGFCLRRARCCDRSGSPFSLIRSVNQVVSLNWSGMRADVRSASLFLAGCPRDAAGCSFRSPGSSLQRAGSSMEPAGCSLRRPGCPMRGAGCSLREMGAALRNRKTLFFDEIALPEAKTGSPGVESGHFYPPTNSK